MVVGCRIGKIGGFDYDVDYVGGLDGGLFGRYGVIMGEIGLF